jgi:hypothetical protein
MMDAEEEYCQFCLRSNNESNAPHARRILQLKINGRPQRLFLCLRGTIQEDQEENRQEGSRRCIVDNNRDQI